MFIKILDVKNLYSIISLRSIGLREVHPYFCQSKIVEVRRLAIRSRFIQEDINAIVESLLLHMLLPKLMILSKLTT